MTSLAARLFDPQLLAVLLVIQGLLLAWRLGALAAVREIAPIRASASTIVAAIVAIAIVAAPQLMVAGLTLDARNAAAEVYAPVDEGGAWVPNSNPVPVASNDPDFAVGPGRLPAAVRLARALRGARGTPAMNVLLVGVDAGVGRTTYLTDTMIVASLDPVAETVSMVSIPRDMVDVPLADGRVSRARSMGSCRTPRHPKQFPGAGTASRCSRRRSASCSTVDM